MKPLKMSRQLSRRSVLKGSAAIGAATTAPARVFAQAGATRESYQNLAPAQAQVLEAIVARLIPSDASGPGALEAGAVRYIDLALADALAQSRETYRSGIAALENYARRTHGRGFAALEYVEQDALLESLEGGEPLPGSDVTAYPPEAMSFFELVLQHTIQGTFCDPHYGGNQDFIGWDMLGYPGLRLAVAPEDQTMDAAPRPMHISAYDLPMFDANDAEPDE